MKSYSYKSKLSNIKKREFFYLVINIPFNQVDYKSYLLDFKSLVEGEMVEQNQVFTLSD